MSPARSFVVTQVDIAPSTTRFTVMRSEPSGEGGRDAEYARRRLSPLTFAQRVKNCPGV